MRPFIQDSFIYFKTRLDVGIFRINVFIKMPMNKKEFCYDVCRLWRTHKKTLQKQRLTRILAQYAVQRNMVKWGVTIMNVKHKLGISAIGLSVIIFGMFLATWWLTGKQKNDGLIVNLAGRQRMLSQKMTKELLYFQMEKIKTGSINEKTAAGIRNTMKVFDTTLTALKDSGDAPLSLNLNKTNYRWCPQVKEPAFTQLEKVKTIWTDFSSHVEGVLSDSETAKQDLNWVLDNNICHPLCPSQLIDETHTV